MVDIDVIGILTEYVLQVIYRSIIYMFNTFNNQADNENNNNPI